jgi:hypothetical protein
MKNTENINLTKSDLHNLLNCIEIALKNGHGKYTWIIHDGNYNTELKDISNKIKEKIRGKPEVMSVIGPQGPTETYKNPWKGISVPPPMK